MRAQTCAFEGFRVVKPTACMVRIGSTSHKNRTHHTSMTWYSKQDIREQQVRCGWTHASMLLSECTIEAREEQPRVKCCSTRKRPYCGRCSITNANRLGIWMVCNADFTQHDQGCIFWGFHWAWCTCLGCSSECCISVLYSTTTETSSAQKVVPVQRR